MAMQRRIKVNHYDAFPAGIFLKGAIEPVSDFNAPTRDDGTKPQQVDKDSGKLVWQGVFIDADEETNKKNTAVTVKFLADHRPVPPENKTGFPWTPVEFVELTASPYIEAPAGDRGKPRIAWSFRAEGMRAPSSTNAAATKKDVA